MGKEEEKFRYKIPFSGFLVEKIKKKENENCGITFETFITDSVWSPGNSEKEAGETAKEIIKATYKKRGRIKNLKILPCVEVANLKQEEKMNDVILFNILKNTVGVETIKNFSDNGSKNPDTYPSRMFIQKTVYVLQVLMDTNLYWFVFHIVGPFSKELSDQVREISKKINEYEKEEFNFNKSGLKLVKKINSFFEISEQELKELKITKSEWYEILASLLYLNREDGIKLKNLCKIILEKKDHLKEKKESIEQIIEKYKNRFIIKKLGGNMEHRTKETYEYPFDFKTTVQLHRPSAGLTSSRTGNDTVIVRLEKGTTEGKIRSEAVKKAKLKVAKTYEDLGRATETKIYLGKRIVRKKTIPKTEREEVGCNATALILDYLD